MLKTLSNKDFTCSKNNNFRLRGSNYRLFFHPWAPANPKDKNIHHGSSTTEYQSINILNKYCKR